jgi:DNA-binding NtrC family response regulator
VPLLVRHFMRALSKDPDRLKVSYDTMSKLQRHRWPGNVRELKNFVERAILLSGGDTLSGEFLESPSPPGASPADFPTHVSSIGGARGPGAPGGLGGPGGPGIDDDGLPVHMDLPFKDAKARLVEAFETAYWRRLLDTTGGNISEAARRAGIHRKSAEYLVKKLELK